MYITFLTLHSILRWLLLLSLIGTIITSLHGYLRKRAYSKSDQLIRIFTNAISHTQLLVGFILYFGLSPLIQLFLKNGTGPTQVLFFAIYHLLMMFVAVVIMTVGGALAKKKTKDMHKFKTTLLYYSVALLLILLAIPWFRPLLRTF